MAQTTFFVSYSCLSKHSNSLLGGPGPNTLPTFRPIFGLADLLQKSLSIKACESKLPLNAKITQNVSFLNESSKIGIPLSHRQFNRKSTFQDGCHRHLGFRETATISSLWNQSSPNLVGMLRIRCRTHMSSKYSKVTRSQDGGCRHFEFWKIVVISLLLDQSSQIWWERCEFD